jgi:hypothetical protein
MAQALKLAPAIAKIRMDLPGWPPLRLWLPIFLLWPLIYLALALAVALFAFFSLAVGKRSVLEYPDTVFAEPFRLLHATRDLSVDVDTNGGRFHVSFD